MAPHSAPGSTASSTGSATWGSWESPGSRRKPRGIRLPFSQRRPRRSRRRGTADSLEDVVDRAAETRYDVVEIELSVTPHDLRLLTRTMSSNGFRVGIDDHHV